MEEFEYISLRNMSTKTTNTSTQTKTAVLAEPAKTLTVDTIDKIRTEIDSIVKTVGEKYGLTIVSGPARYNDVAGTMKLEICTRDAKGTTIDAEMATLKYVHKHLGLKESHLTQPFTLSGKKVILSGYKRARYAKPFRVRDLETGADYRARVDDVKHALGIRTA